MFSRRSFLAWLPAFLGGVSAAPRLTDGVIPTPRGGMAPSAPEHKTRLIGRMAKVFAMLSDASYAIAHGNLDEAEGLLEGLSDAECFVTTSDCFASRRDL